MAQLKSTLGAKARPTNRPIAPKIDVAEQQEFARPKDSNYRTLPYILAGLSLAAVAAFLVRRRYMASVLLLGLVPLNGCGQKPVPRLTAAFTQSRVLYDPSRPSLSLDLQISNAGNQTLRIMKVDAGCSCRHVDPSQLPATLKPGEHLNLAVGMSGGRNYSPQTYQFTFTTDQGPLTAPVSLLSLPTHLLSPDTITLSGLNEKSTEEESGFDLVQREVYRPGSRDTEASLVIPAGFVKQGRGVHEGRVADAPDLAYRDTEYHLTLKDPTLGLHRADIVLNGADGRKLIAVPLVWQRLPFLSCVPDRVALSKRSARVFLRCPDESVELSRVSSAPPGVKAELDSPRSIRVTMTDDAPTTLDGFVEVETTSADSGPLQIPVARYAPLARQ